MGLRTYLFVVLGITVPPLLVAAVILLSLAGPGRPDARWGEGLWIYAVSAPALAAGLQKLFLRDFILRLPPASPDRPHEASKRFRRWMRITLATGFLILAPLYVRVCAASGWEKVTASWSFDADDSVLAYGIAGAAVEGWPFVLLGLCSLTWIAAISGVRTRELDLSWERSRRDR